MSSPVSTEMGDHSWAYHLGVQPATQANSASYPKWDRKQVLAKEQWQHLRKGDKLVSTFL